MTLLQGGKNRQCTHVVTAFAEGKCGTHRDGGHYAVDDITCAGVDDCPATVDRVGAVCAVCSAQEPGTPFNNHMSGKGKGALDL